jgi:hypothetical protein
MEIVIVKIMAYYHFIWRKNMDIDFEELEKEVCCKIGGSYNEIFQYTKDEIHEGVEKLKSMPIKDIKKIWDDVVDEINAVYIDAVNDGEYSDDDLFYIKEDFLEPYFEDHPDEKEDWDKNHNINEDEFTKYLQEHDRYEEYNEALSQWADEFLANGALGNEMHDDYILKVSEKVGLPAAIIDYLCAICDWG